MTAGNLNSGQSEHTGWDHVVDEVHPGGVDFDQHLVGRDCRAGNLLKSDVRRLAIAFECEGFHCALIPMWICRCHFAPRRYGHREALRSIALTERERAMTFRLSVDSAQRRGFGEYLTVSPVELDALEERCTTDTV